MGDQKHTELLSLQSAEITGRTPFCLEDQQIAELYEGTLPEAERSGVERHVADCRFCAARIGLLARLDAEGDEARVPEDSLATAKLMSRPQPRANRRMASWAAVAVLVLAVGIYFQVTESDRPGSNPESPAGPPDLSGEIRDTRTIDTTALGPTITSPLEGRSAGANSLISWTAVPNSLFYEVRIVSDDGDLLWQERIEDTECRVPNNLDLVPGSEYFIRIDAYPTEAKSLQSDYLLFRYGGGG